MLVFNFTFAVRERETYKLFNHLNIKNFGKDII